MGTILHVPPQGHAACALLLFVLFLNLAPVIPKSAGPEGPDFRDRWAHLSTNLLVDDNVASAQAHFRRAAKSGYMRIMLAGCKFQILEQINPHARIVVWCDM